MKINWVRYIDLTFLNSIRYKVIHINVPRDFNLALYATSANQYCRFINLVAKVPINFRNISIWRYPLSFPLVSRYCIFLDIIITSVRESATNYKNILIIYKTCWSSLPLVSHIFDLFPFIFFNRVPFTLVKMQFLPSILRNSSKNVYKLIDWIICRCKKSSLLFHFPLNHQRLFDCVHKKSVFQNTTIKLSTNNIYILIIGSHRLWSCRNCSW